MNKLWLTLLLSMPLQAMDKEVHFKEGAPRRPSIESDVSGMTENDETAAKILVRDYFTDTDDLEQYVLSTLKRHAESPLERDRARSLKRKISHRGDLPDHDTVYAYDVLLESMKEAYAEKKHESKSKITKKAAIALSGLVGSGLALATAIVTFYSSSCDK